MEPDYYGYSFYVDSAPVYHPSNPLFKYNLLNTENQGACPGGPASLPWEVEYVPRGQLHRHSYKSKIAEDVREFIVYTPPDYDPSGKHVTRCCIWLHGFSDMRPSDFRRFCECHFGNLISRNEVKR